VSYDEGKQALAAALELEVRIVPIETSGFRVILNPTSQTLNPTPQTLNLNPLYKPSRI